MMKTQLLSFVLLYLFLVPSWAKTEASEILNLTAFLQLVQQQSPDIQIQNFSTDEAAARAEGIRISPPMVGVMNMRDAGGNNRGFEVSQEIPFPTKISKEAEVRKLQAQAERSGSFYRKNEILLEARKAYFEFWRSYERAKIAKEKRDWLKKHLKLVRASTRSDSEAQVYLLSVESELDLLENEVLESQTEISEKRNLLRVFSPQLQDQKIVPEEPEMKSIEVDKASQSSLISWKKNEVKAAEAEKDLAKQSALPDIYVRYRGFNGNEMTPQNEEVMIGITVPFLFFWQPQAQSAESAAKLQKTQAELQKVQVEYDSRLSSLLERTKSLKMQLETLNDKLIPRGQKRVKIVENLSRRTMEGLNEHRTVMLDYLELRLKALEVRLEYENAYSEIMKLINKEAIP